jgi:hypothetical protein
MQRLNQIIWTRTPFINEHGRAQLLATYPLCIIVALILLPALDCIVYVIVDATDPHPVRQFRRRSYLPNTVVSFRSRSWLSLVVSWKDYLSFAWSYFTFGMVATFVDDDWIAFFSFGGGSCCNPSGLRFTISGSGLIWGVNQVGGWFSCVVCSCCLQAMFRGYALQTSRAKLAWLESC